MSAGELHVVEQHAAVRRVALLVATGAVPADVFAAIAEEVAALMRPRLVQLCRYERDGTVTIAGTWSEGDTPNPFPAGSVWTWDEHPTLRTLRDTLCAGAPIRVEAVAEELAGAPVDAAVDAGVGSIVGAPVMVDGEAWGHIGVAMAKDQPLPDRIEERLAEFTELVAPAIASSETRGQLARLAEEQAALRRVATLVAGGAPPAQVFDTVAEEVGRLLDAPQTVLARIDGDSLTFVASWGRLGAETPTGTRLPLGGVNVMTTIARTGRPARLDDFTRVASGPLGEQPPGLRLGTVIGSPIIVAGQLWGTMTAAILEGATVRADAEARLVQFSELIATAISNTQARVELAQVASEQAALRRVATLVAEEAPADVLLARVAEEVGCLLGPGADTAIVRYEPDETATVTAVWGLSPPSGNRVGDRMALDGGGVAVSVHRERRPVRVDHDEVGCPILVQNRLWGAIIVAHAEPGALPSDTEHRVMQFTELVSTAIANAEARDQLERLAAEQAALRRVATLVAQETAPADVFDAVTYEVRELLGAAQAGLLRIESTGEATIIAMNGQDPDFVGVGLRLSMEGDSATARVVRSGRSARIDATEGSGPLIDVARRTNVDVTLGAPVTIENRVWGVMTVSWRPGEQPPADAEARLAEFAELLDTAIANADTRDQLTASRARVIGAADAARRRVVRDLHDGAQQRLVHAIITLKLAQRALPDNPGQARDLLAEALAHAEHGNTELRELAHGILPAVLTRGGLADGVGALIARLDVAVDADVTPRRLAPEIEASAYFIVAEALTNVTKHACASRASVCAAVRDGALRVEVRDDGCGGADPQGHGLIGLADRVAALGGKLRISSPPGAGTVLVAVLPLPA